jgi:hypothetical protein
MTAVFPPYNRGTLEPLPVRPGLYYRLHHPAVPLDPRHARSVPMHGAFPIRPGFSALADPHSLWRYLHEMDWIAAPRAVDFHERQVVAFTGTPVGVGIDSEPLVLPESCVLRLSWPRFETRLAVTPRPQRIWSAAQGRRPS